MLAAALHHSPALYATGLAAAVVSAVYSIKALWYVWQPVPAGAAAGYDTERAGTRRVAPGDRRRRWSSWRCPPRRWACWPLPAVAGPLDRALGAAGRAVARLVAAGRCPRLLAVAASGLTWWRAARRVPVPAAVTGWLARWLDLERAAARPDRPPRPRPGPGSWPASTTGSSTAASTR